MPITLLWIVLVCLLVIGLFVAKQWNHYRIRKTGTCVLAEVIQVRSSQDLSLSRDISPQIGAIPLVGGRWEYEIVAQWKDPQTGETHLLTSGRGKGLPKYQQGDHLSAYISSKGNYLVL